MTHPWEHALDFLHADGWDFQLAIVPGPNGDGPRRLVEISRDGVRYAASAPTLDEAVGSIYGMVAVMARRQKTSLPRVQAA